MTARVWHPSSLLIAALLFALVAQASAGDWPHWRGPDRNDISSEVSGYADGRWNVAEAWRVEVGAGGAGPVAIGDAVYTFGWLNDTEQVLCLEAATGAVRWKQTAPAPSHSRHAFGETNLYSGPSASPAFDSTTGFLFTLGADADLRCWNTRDNGRLVWQKNLIETYQVPQRPKSGRVSIRDYGYTGAPLVLEDVVIAEVGAPNATVIAYSTRTGEEAWRSRAGGPAGHSGGPVPLTLDGIPCVAVFRMDGLLVVRCDGERSGETVCEIPWQTNYANNVAGPTILGKSVLLTSEYNQAKIARYELSLTAPPQKVWEQESSSRVCSPVIHKGRVYWAWRTMHCLDFATGQPIFVGGETGDAGSIIVTSDDRLLLWSGQGDLKLLDGGPEFRELGALKGLGAADAWPHITLAHGRAYCQDRNGRLVCVKLGAP